MRRLAALLALLPLALLLCAQTPLWPSGKVWMESLDKSLEDALTDGDLGSDQDAGDVTLTPPSGMTATDVQAFANAIGARRGTIPLAITSWTSGDCMAFGAGALDVGAPCTDAETELRFATGRALISLTATTGEDFGTGVTCEVDVLLLAPTGTAPGSSLGTLTWGDSDDDERGEVGASLDLTGNSVAAGGAIQMQVSASGSDSCSGFTGSLELVTEAN